MASQDNEAILGARERAYLTAFTNATTPSEDVTRRAFAGLEPRVASDEERVTAIDPAWPSHSSRRPLWIGVAVVVIAAAAIVLIGIRLDLSAILAREDNIGTAAEAVYAGRDSGGAQGHAAARSRDEHTPPPSAAVPPKGTETRAASETVEEPSEEPSSAEPDSHRRSRPQVRNAAKAGHASTTTPEPKETAPDATLHAEMALLRPALQALRAGDHARALRLLDGHAKSFPRSALAEERTMARITALCELGRGTEARSESKRFARDYAGSPLQGRAAKACPELSGSP